MIQITKPGKQKINNSSNLQQPTTSTRLHTQDLQPTTTTTGQFIRYSRRGHPKMTVDGYQLLKMNELIKNAAAWRARMPKTGRFDKYFDNKETTKTTPKVQINSATLQVMGQAAKDYDYTKDEFIEAVEMYEHLVMSTWKMFRPPVLRIDYGNSTNPTLTTRM